MSDTDGAYIGISPCGHVNFVCVDRPDLANEIASAIRRGMTLERMTVAEARLRLASGMCDCEQRAKAAARAAKNPQKALPL